MHTLQCNKVYYKTVQYNTINTLHGTVENTVTLKQRSVSTLKTAMAATEVRPDKHATNMLPCRNHQPAFQNCVFHVLFKKEKQIMNITLYLPFLSSAFIQQGHKGRPLQKKVDRNCF